MKKIITLTMMMAFITGCNQAPQEPQISFSNDVMPLITKNCTECHTSGGDGANASGFITTDYDAIMKGTKYGPVVIPGNSVASTFYRLIAGLVDPSIQMPHGKEAMSAADIAKVEKWIEQGAKNN
ncbi:MAG: hypothetical protein QNJ56_10170 [Gammaproteobacteria bacterium]|nr:hypothetical protein [Gammaproteobacteria bacterium]